jgi:hypothetical protein
MSGRGTCLHARNGKAGCRWMLLILVGVSLVAVEGWLGGVDRLCCARGVEALDVTR